MKKTERLFKVIVIFTIMLLTQGCVTTNRSAKISKGDEIRMSVLPEIAVATTRFHKEYVLVPEDIVEVVLLKHPEITRVCTIRPDGYISLPILDDVKAAGLTPGELDKKLTEMFSHRLKEPEVTVIVTKFQPPVIYVIGEVTTPSVVSVHDAATAFQAVTRAGGFTNEAKRNSVIIIRVTEDNYLTATRVNLQLKGQSASYITLHNVPLQADDIIFVPKTFIARVDIFIEQHINKILIGAIDILTTLRLIEILGEEE
ncbi:MAG: polysaccharide biosynthesis/export family protein [bacterium]